MALPPSADNERPPRRARTADALLVAALALVPRLMGLGTTVTWDEPAWAFRTIRFWQAFLAGRATDTVIAPHPGITTVWLGGAGLFWSRLADPWRFDGISHMVATLDGLHLDDGRAVSALSTVLAAATVPVAVANALGVLLSFLLAARLFDRWTALLFGGLLALDPHHVALSRVLHVDGLQATWGCVGLLAAGVFAVGGGGRYAVFSGIACALALLAKAPAAYAALWAVALVAAAGGRRGERALGFAGWGFAALGTVVFLWPAFAADPVATLHAVAAAGGRAVDRVVDTSQFVLGRVVDVPGPELYLVALAARTSPVVVVGFVVALLAWRWMGRRERRALVLAAAMGGGYIALLTLSDKKFDRYVLPAAPAWILVAALGFGAVAAALARRSPRAPGAVVGVVLAAQGLLLVRAMPYPIAWYSPFVGGVRGATQLLPVGWGEGLDQVAGYLEERQGYLELGFGPQLTLGGVVMTRAVPGLAPLYPGLVLPWKESSAGRADWIVRYVADTQRPAEPWEAPLLRAAPVFTATVAGAPYAWVYPNVALAPLEDALAREPIPVVAEDWGALGGRDAVWLEDDPASVPEILASAAKFGALWWVSGPDPSPAAREADFRLAGAGHLAEQLAALGTTLTRYEVRDADPGADLLPLVEAPLQPTFGDVLRLDGAERTPAAPASDRALGVRSRWHWLTDERPDLTVFLHLVGADGHIWGQTDVHVPRSDDAPVLDLLVRPWPGAPPGSYTLRAGAYRADDRSGLTVDGAPWVDLGAVDVGRPLAAPELAAFGDVTKVTEEWPGLRLVAWAPPETARAGGTGQLSFIWEVNAPERVPRDLLLQLGTAPPQPLVVPWQAARAGDRLRSIHDVTLPPDARTGLAVRIGPPGTLREVGLLEVTTP